MPLPAAVIADKQCSLKTVACCPVADLVFPGVIFIAVFPAVEESTFLVLDLSTLRYAHLRI
jgi:hypothetical protein